MRDAERYRYVNEVPDRNANTHQSAQMLALALLGFLIPFLIPGPQILTGILVNALIIRAAIALPSWKTLPVIFTPSIGALAQGVLFGPFSMFLVFMMPFIWAGNLILAYAISSWKRNTRGYFFALGAGSLAKAGLLYATAYMLYSASIIPAIFLTAMGTIQVATAVLGGIVVYVELRTEKYFFRIKKNMCNSKKNPVLLIDQRFIKG